MIDPAQEQLWKVERHRAEVRMLLRRLHKQGRDAVIEYVDDPKVKGRRAALVRDYNEQRKRGNTGGVGMWVDG